MNIFRTAFRLTLPVLGAYWFMGVTYGLLAASLGYSIWIPIAMAMLVYSGSVEFIALTLLMSTFHPLSAFIMAFMVGARHLFYGISMLDRYSGAGWRKWPLIYWLTDETFAVNFSNKDDINLTGNPFGCYLWISALDYFYWVSGAFMGYSNYPHHVVGSRAYSLSAISCVFKQGPHTSFRTVLRSLSCFCRLWYVGDQLSERYRHPFTSPFCSKALCHYCLYPSSSLATQYASHHCWWHHLLHDFTPILIIFFHLSFRYLNKKA